MACSARNTQVLILFRYKKLKYLVFFKEKDSLFNYKDAKQFMNRATPQRNYDVMT